MIDLVSRLCTQTPGGDALYDLHFQHLGVGSSNKLPCVRDFFFSPRHLIKALGRDAYTQHEAILGSLGPARCPRGNA